MRKKVLFVCLGNICRSPLAEAIFNHHAQQQGLDFTSDSCGTANYHVGDAPDPRTIRVAHQHGVAIQHVGRQLALRDFDEFDLILAMDSDNYRNILTLAKSNTHPKVKLMREFDPMGKGNVPDPYYGGLQEFQEVYDILNRSMKNLLRQLQHS